MSRVLTHSCPETFYENFDRKGGDQHVTHYCPGCGHGVIHKLVAEAVDHFGLQDRTVFVGSVGCSVFAYYYFDVGNVQVAHGRCPAAATAVKRAHPEGIVIGYQGDGDLAAIGGNEILHAANRGENISIFFVNNAIYGMTGGQMAPTTLLGMKTTTTPEGRQPASEGFPIRVCELLSTLQAPYYLERVAIGDPKHNARARKAIQRAIRNQMDHRGFSLVEILSPCPTGWKMAPVDSTRFTLEEMTRTFPLGVFRDGHELDLGHPRRRLTVEPAEIPAVLDIEDETGDTELPDRGRAIEEQRIKVSGFGGQGVLMLGTVLAHAGMLAGRQVSWMPSYGPEMRGGAAYCDVTLSDQEIGSPLVPRPTLLVSMNRPSFDKFGPTVAPAGTIFYNSSMIDGPLPREDIRQIAVPATEIAEGLGDAKCANMVVLGAILGHDCPLSREALFAALESIVGSAELLELDRRAIEAGLEAAAENLQLCT